jgi:hypothetical protein
MAMLWGRRVIVASVKQDKPVWYVGHADGRTEETGSRP